ncbi:class I SAM-dependent methyltransferase [Agromyces sp. ISL-38]|uniref:class I SAM-dependent methyltransferase n=1 Tax=Agromyces sp. ISL-38 TaxID=2819107 RepID=UPI001BEB84B1|nr:class I SAM-dependent methyltransferase [Agromyces sp. ISL-38]MBT2499354.1 class I SAM-dependent methyltransferase [Agromyces sp. ISL-38]
MTSFKEHAAEQAENAKKADASEPDAPVGADASEKADAAGKLTLAEILEILTAGRLPLRFTAYDGSSAGPPDATFGLDLKTPRGTTYLATGRGDLGLARAYIAGDLEAHGVHPGDPYELLKALADDLVFKLPSPRVMAQIFRSIGVEHLRPIAPPPQEVPPRWRRIARGLRHSKTRDAEAIHHHYDVSNTFYEWVLGPSMTYTCACYPRSDASLDEAQENKYRLVFEKLRLKPGDRLLDVGCGWGGMVRYAARRGVRALGVTLSEEQTSWAQQAIADEGLTELAEVRYGDYRDIAETGFDAVSSIGLLEHIGVRNYSSYFTFLQSRMRPGALLLNHCITRPDNRHEPSTRGFIDRYVFPDGELTGSGRIISEAQDVGLEVLHEENLRPHYAMTLRDWCANLVEHWDEAVAEVGLPTAKVWGLYMAGSRLAFETGGIQLHQVLAVKPGAGDGDGGVPLRPWWTP